MTIGFQCEIDFEREADCGGPGR